MPGVGLMQLVAYGPQDMYLTGNRQISFWSTSNIRRTNITMENLNKFDINLWPIKYIIILETDHNIECPIILEQINLNDQYCRCDKCKYNFSKEALIDSFKTKISCPMCRGEWTDKTLYINKHK